MLFIFDWDGTLSDSTANIIHCVQQAARNGGYPVLADDTIREIIGLGLPEAMQRLYPNLSHHQRDDMRQHYVDYFVSTQETPSPFFIGVDEGLNRLRDAGFTLAVATGKSRKGLNRVLRSMGMLRFFDGSRCADETASKPSPLMLQELCQEFNCAPEQSIMVGDTEFDMEMAELIAMPRVAVSYGAHHIDRLAAYNPILKIDQFSELVEWVLQRYVPIPLKNH